MYVLSTTAVSTLQNTEFRKGENMQAISWRLSCSSIDKVVVVQMYVCECLGAHTLAVFEATYFSMRMKYDVLEITPHSLSEQRQAERFVPRSKLTAWPVVTIEPMKEAAQTEQYGSKTTRVKKSLIMLLVVSGTPKRKHVTVEHLFGEWEHDVGDTRMQTEGHI